MPALRFDEGALIKRLRSLTPALRVAFAAACAERQLPAYRAFHARTRRGRPQALAEILDRLWRDLAGDQMSSSQIAAALQRCMALIPREDEGPWVAEQAYAEDAAADVAYALRARLNGDEREAAWAARRAYDALDHFVINRFGLTPGTPDGEEQVANHPLVQNELGRQERDLGEMERAGSADPVLSLVAETRVRAQQEARAFFGHSL